MVIGAIAYYGSLTHGSNNSSKNNTTIKNDDLNTAPNPRFRQLLSLEDRKTKRGDVSSILDEALTKAQANVVKANPKSTPPSPGRQKGIFLLRTRRSSSTLTTVKKSTDAFSAVEAASDGSLRSFSVGTSSSGARKRTTKPITPTLAPNHHKASPILNGLVLKTRQFLMDFARHLWIKCRLGLPFRFFRIIY